MQARYLIGLGRRWRAMPVMAGAAHFRFREGNPMRPVTRASRSDQETLETLVTLPGVAGRRLDGPRCLSCTGPIADSGDEAVCLDCGASFALTPAGVIEATANGAEFVHGLDSEIDALVGVLDRLEAPACTEKAIAAYAETVGVDTGNPFWEGRADVARL